MSATITAYVPKFRVSAAQVAADTWNMPEPDPDHVRLITAIRRLPGQANTVAEARAESAAISAKIAARDWTRWRSSARSEVRHA